MFLVLFALALPSFAQKPGQTKTIHFDLTKMSGTVVFAMVNRMVTEPVKFQGKHIKMAGVFSSYYDDQIGCSQGLAFELAKPRKYPKEYPAEGDAIIVEGDFDYEKDEGGGGFPIIRNAEMQTKK